MTLSISATTSESRSSTSLASSIRPWPRTGSSGSPTSRRAAEYRLRLGLSAERWRR